MRASERACPFCGAARATRGDIAEFTLKNAWDRRRIARFGALLGAAGIALACREAPPVAVYGAPPSPDPTASSEPQPPPAPSSEAAPAPDAAPSPPADPAPPTAPSGSVLAPAPAPKPTPAPKPAPASTGDPDRRLAPAYGGPPPRTLELPKPDASK